MGRDQDDLEAADALLDLSRVLMGITLRAVASAPVPLTVPQHRVLLTIAAEGPRRVGTLATDLGVNQSNASRIVDRLVHLGLVRRARDDADARVSLVELTPEGAEVLRAVHERRLAAVLELVAEMPSGSRGLVAVLGELGRDATGDAWR
jgi:DNA-binding MarR family transcriptional regulator